MNQNKLFKNFMEDASFYYEQRKYLLNKPDFHWKDIENTEERLETVLKSFFPEKNRKAVDFCLSIKDFSDIGEFYVFITILIRSKLYEELYLLIEQPVFLEDKERYTATVDALKKGLPEEQIILFIERMEENQNYIPLVLDLCGYRRIEIKPDRLDFIIKSKEYTDKLVWYMGRVKQYSADFTEYIKSEDPALYYETAIAVMRIKNESLTEELYKDLHERDLAVILKSLTGSEEFDGEISEYFNNNKNENSILAIALTGKIEFVPELIQLLELEELKDITSLSLHILTGAGIEEDVFIYEEIDEDTLFDDEKERMNNGENPYKESEGYGEKVKRISQNPANWRKWLDDNGRRFNRNTRYRLGLPFSKTSLIGMLDSNLPIQIRKIAYEELSIHFDVDDVFEPDMFVKEQIKAIEDMKNK